MEYISINGFEKYKISKDGKVYNTLSNKHMKLVENKGTGYLQVNFFNNGKVKGFQVHRLVAQYFIPNPENKPQVNHKNGIKTDNRVDNLEWMTDSENKYHCYKTGLKDQNIISKPILQIDIVSGKILNRYDSANEASRVNGFNQGNISNCCIGRCKTSMGYKWSYE